MKLPLFSLSFPFHLLSHSNCLLLSPALSSPTSITHPHFSGATHAFHLTSAEFGLPNSATMDSNGPIWVCRAIPGIQASETSAPTELSLSRSRHESQFRSRWSGCGFSCISISEKREFAPSPALLLKHPLALVGLVPKEAALFAAGAVAGAAAKTVTAPLDRIKLLMQTHGVRVGQETAKKAIGFLEAITMIGREEGLKGYWKGNLPQVIRVIPYSAVQLFSYEIYKKLFRGKEDELSVVGRLAAGACAGMTSTLLTYPLDVLRLRLAVEPGYRTMSQVAFSMLREEGIASFYKGLGPSLIGIAPYIAVNFCVFDLVKKSLPEKYQNRPESTLVTALVSASIATLSCYPLDTVRRQMQMKGTPYKSVIDALRGIVEREGWLGLYRGFLPNALKTLPNSSIRLTSFDTVKGLIAAGEKELQKLKEENKTQKLSTGD